jgi:hypothetical protein
MTHFCAFGLLQILIANVSECEEAVLSAIFDLLALIKPKDENTIYFSTKSLEKPLAWAPKVSVPVYAFVDIVLES